MSGYAINFLNSFQRCLQDMGSAFSRHGMIPKLKVKREMDDFN